MGNLRLLVTARSFARYDAEPIDRLKANSIEMIRSKIQGPLNEEGLLKAIDEAGHIDAIMVGNDAVTAKVLEKFLPARVVSRYGVGVDNIDIQAAKALGITVTNTPGTNDRSVADLAMGLVLSCARLMPWHMNSVQKGSWDRKMGYELGGKVLGIIGMGRVGKGLAVRASSFGMKLVGFDKYWDEGFAEANNVTFASIEEILRISDFVSLHIPATPETENIINAESIAAMKTGASLINTARGELIDEKALAEAVKAGKLRAAAVDVTRSEPPAGSPLIGIDNIMITPHIGANTEEAGKLMSSIAAENVIEVLSGKECNNKVN